MPTFKSILILIFIFGLTNFYQGSESAIQSWIQNNDIYDSISHDWMMMANEPERGSENFETALTSLKRKRSESSSPSSSSTPLPKCQTMETAVDIKKEEHSSSGEFIRRCQGTATVTKCEGACVSNLRPSINTVTGLLKVLSLKECNCCRESIMQSKHIVLDSCFDLDGNLLEGDTMTVMINEPHRCACFKCSN